jgi:hypothetical protein
MTQVLNSDKAVRDKVQAYNQILQRYLVQQSKCIDSPIEVRVRPDSKVDTVDESTIEEPKLDTVEVDVFDSVPKTFTRKAQLLMRRLRKQPEVRWNEKGEVILKGKHIPGSNLADLVNDVLRSRKTMTDPVGWEDFAAHLQVMNLPQEIIGNKSRMPFIKRNNIPSPPGERSAYSPSTELSRKSKHQWSPQELSRNKTRRKRKNEFYDKWTPYYE